MTWIPDPDNLPISGMVDMWQDQLRDMGKTWQVASTIATATAIRALGVPVTMPWFENMVARVADGSPLAVIRTSSNSRGAIVAARSSDNGATWSAPERLLANRVLCRGVPRPGARLWLET
ncbi:MAG: exo-alpha-sialidase [Verrucomicrobia bacterium]|nr:exo-alpha-sialidase [Verrucomicrobiota bacterium]